ncbi:nuclear protein localization protein [Capsaspora owczarzaki ATCC 30864]|uniref:Nuclear protein localization protein n=1 Tax=Capsaspora owczarzaki (strain ATCC 30864) TaxID=595528 RepID=A0A0D2WUC6_CAPO3|nr:nuclear protein localization protein [Capsaspora owczarzaki ATCC 30864]KJE95503.1 nuclear protein localization protein [Capsaspora owczarzaki ATCC 30864]|eukprot:XP_004345541.2 nuclear protein localization protein [Capsaspora owczarzaki ATCC 30864]
MLVRVRSKTGTARVELADDVTGQQLILEIQRQLNLPADGSWTVSKQPTGQLAITARTRQPDIKHGDMLYVSYLGAGANVVSGGAVPMDLSDTPSTTSLASSAPEPIKVVEDAVDVYLSKQDGKIQRKREAPFCKHGANGMCDNCCPVEPYDAKYLEANGIKHLSFHAYLRKLRSGADGGKFTPLSVPQMTIRPGCTAHAPWPAGICTKCQPSAVTLARQAYRHVDYVEFEQASILNQFIDFWRQSGGVQRLGYLIGRYEPYPEVPLGIKAVVAAIYEPPQTGAVDSLELLDDPNEEAVLGVASALGLQRVGWIFTDLEDDGTRTGMVQCKRHKDTFFLSASEIMMAADLQARHPNPTTAASTGEFGSKFVTVVISGNASREVSLEAYQVSNQCATLVQNEFVVPSTRDPSAMTVRETTDAQYIPEVFYRYKNEYGTEVVSTARPSFPVDYLIVNLGNGSPQSPNPTFGLGISTPFTIGNRSVLGQNADVVALKSYLAAQPSNAAFLALVSDFHLLVFLATSSVLMLSNSLPELLQAIKNRDSAAANQWQQSPQWQTVLQIASSVSSAPGAIRGGAAGVADAWHCSFCTLINAAAKDSCDACGLPRSQ